jgi:DNA repair protein RecN (Recombination protein N)
VLLELVVENYAVVERLRVRFHAGLNLLTGETGSGKSIVVDALGLLLGGRASADAIRTGATRARVAGIFEAGASEALRRVLDEAGIEIEDGELLIEREVQASGKSRAFVGSRPVAVSLLKELAPHLADIHGQHDQQLLFSPEAQREMLDAFAEAGTLTARVASLHAEWRAAAAALEDIERTDQERVRLLDLWSFQRKEIESTSPAAGEDKALENERRVLQNVQRLEEAASAAYSAIYDGDLSASSLTRSAGKRVEELVRIDPSLAPLEEHLRAASLSLQEASYLLRDYLSRLEANPARLEDVESRLAILDRLKRKYGASLAEVLEFLSTVRRQIEEVENTSEHKAALEATRARLASEFEKSAASLGGKRRAAARKLEKSVEAELAGLAMEGTVFRVSVSEAPWSAHGTDAIEFLVSPNLGEEPRPLEKVASGGEISRIALALKTCLASPRAATLRTLVFDEVDAGIGGSAAEGVGRRLKQLSATSQVLCVTHLAQVASFADHHYRVEKLEAKGRTVAAIEELGAEGRTQEVGRMLSGQTLTPEALRHAEQLIRMSTTASPQHA